MPCSLRSVCVIPSLKPAYLNPTRSKFRTLLYNDLKDTVGPMGISVAFFLPLYPQQSRLLEHIVELEDALSAAFNSSPNDITPNYRQHFRDIRFNLEKNRQLLGDWLFGELESKKLASMTAEEMMSDDVRKQVESVFSR